MLTINYELYEDDYRRSDKTKTFNSYKELEDWIFGQMKQKYTNSCAMFFPECPTMERVDRIEFHPSIYDYHYWIHMITESDWISFSDGKHTSGKKYVTEEVKDWLAHCRQHQKNPTFNFKVEKPKVLPKAEPIITIGKMLDIISSDDDYAVQATKINGDGAEVYRSWKPEQATTGFKLEDVLEEECTYFSWRRTYEGKTYLVFEYQA